MNGQKNQLKLNKAVNFFIAVTLLNETLDEVISTDLFKHRNKVKGKALIKYFQPLEDKLYDTFQISNNEVEELQFQENITNIQLVVEELATLDSYEIENILEAIQDFKKDKESLIEQKVSA